jgi:hypothetical protein
MIVVTVPTEETKNRLRAVLQNAPIALNVDEMYVELSQDQVVSNYTPMGPFRGRFIEFRCKYGQNEERMELVGVLESEEMARACAFYEVPEGWEVRLIFNTHVALSSAVRSFLASVSDTLCMKEEQPFTFEETMLLTLGT